MNLSNVHSSGAASAFTVLHHHGLCLAPKHLPHPEGDPHPRRSHSPTQTLQPESFENSVVGVTLTPDLRPRLVVAGGSTKTGQKTGKAGGVGGRGHWDASRRRLGTPWACTIPGVTGMFSTFVAEAGGVESTGTVEAGQWPALALLSVGSQASLFLSEPQPPSL